VHLARRRPIIFIFNVLLAGTLAQWQAPARAETPQESAARLLQEGRDLLAKGDYGQAVIVLMKAQGTVPSAEIQLEIGAAYEGLDDPVKAAELYEKLMDDEGLFGKLKERCKTRLDELRKKLGRLTIECRVKDADVTVNEREVGKTPLPHSVYVEPGEVAIVVKTASRKVELDHDVAAGEHKKVQVSFKEPPKRIVSPSAPAPMPAPSQASAQQAPPPAARRATPKPVREVRDRPRGGWILGRRWTWIAAAGTVVVGAVGMGLGISAASEYSEYKDDSTPSARYPELEDSISAKATTANVMFGVAGGLAVATVALFFIEGAITRSHAERPDLDHRRRWATAGPTPEGDGGQVTFGFSF
jgi:hypothetical protein